MRRVGCLERVEETKKVTKMNEEVFNPNLEWMIYGLSQDLTVTSGAAKRAPVKERIFGK